MFQKHHVREQKLLKRVPWPKEQIFGSFVLTKCVMTFWGVSGPFYPLCRQKGQNTQQWQNHPTEGWNNYFMPILHTKQY